MMGDQTEREAFKMKLGPLDFTEAQWKILKHRLDVPEAIADVLHCDGYDVETIQEIARVMSRGQWPVSYKKQKLEVLREAVTGSTYIAGLPEYQRGPARRAGRNLARKVSEYIGEDVEIPER